MPFERWLQQAQAAAEREEAEGRIPADKERLVFCTLHAELADLDEALAALGAQDDFLVEEEDDDEVVFRRVRPYPKGHWSPLAGTPGALQAIGTVRVGPGYLEGEAPTRGWMVGLCMRLLDVLGKDAIAFDSVEEQDVQRLVEAAQEG